MDAKTNISLFCSDIKKTVKMTSNFSGAYKMKSGNFDKTSVRVRRKSSEWKNNRVDGVNKLRHLDKLSPLQEDTPHDVDYDGKTPRKNTKECDSMKTKVADRREQLSKWLQQKEMKKKLQAKEKAKKQPFKVVHTTHKDAELYKTKVKPVQQKEAAVGTKDPRKIVETKKNLREQPTNRRTDSKKDTKVKEKLVAPSSKPHNPPSPNRRVTRQSAKQASSAPVNKRYPTNNKTKGASSKTDRMLEKPDTRSIKKENKEKKMGPEINCAKVNLERGNSFAPADFTFEAPSNVTSFMFKPLSPTSAANFLFPSISMDAQPSMLETPVPDGERNYRFSTPKTAVRKSRVEHSPKMQLVEIPKEAQGDHKEEVNQVCKGDSPVKNQQSESDMESSSQSSDTNIPSKDGILNTPRRSSRIRKSQIFAAESKFSDSGVSLGHESSKVMKMECDTTVSDVNTTSVVHSPKIRSTRKSLLQEKEFCSSDVSKEEPESTTSDSEMICSETLVNDQTQNNETGEKNLKTVEIIDSAVADCSNVGSATDIEKKDSAIEVEVIDHTKNVINSVSEISISGEDKTTSSAETSGQGADASESVKETPIRTRNTRKTMSTVDEFVKPSPEMAPSSQRRSAKKRRRTEASSTPSLVRSPEEWVKILETSPMIEMGRRTPKAKTPSEREIPPLDLDDIDDVDLDSVDDVFASTSENNSKDTNADCTIENKENICPTVSSSSDMEEPVEANRCIQNGSEPETLLEPDLLSGEHNIAYFRNILLSETARLNKLGQDWNDTMALFPDLSEEHEGQIRTTIGQSQLLMNQRFKQFTGLVDNCEFKTGEKETTCTDLQGFWDMIYFQVEDVDKKFSDLDKLKANNWVEEKSQPVKKIIPKKKLPPKSKPTGKSKFSAFRAQMKKEQEEKIVFDAGFFKVSSPVKSPAFHCEGGTPKKKCTDTRSSQVTEVDTVKSPDLKTSEENTSSTNNESDTLKQNLMSADMSSGVNSTKRRSYIPAIPSPLLKDSTPKVEPRRRSMRNTPLPKRLLSLDDSISEMNDMMKDLSEKQLLKTPVSSTTPRRLSLRRSIQKRKSVSFMETKENTEPESDPLAKYLQPTPIMSSPVTRSRSNSLSFDEVEENKENKENDDVFLKYIQPSNTCTEYDSSKQKKSSCLKILPSSERRKSRRSVRFESSPSVDYCYRTRHASTPYNKSSLVQQRRVDKDDSYKASPQLCTPQKSSSADLMSFSPW